jgi:hypothetical protein
MDLVGLLNQNPYMSAISMIFMNLGSRYIALDISAAQEKLLQNPVVRRITIFCIIYVATRDIMTSCVLLAAFIFVTGHILHEDSPLSILPSSLRECAAREATVEAEEGKGKEKENENERRGYTPRPRSQELTVRNDTPLLDRPAFRASGGFSELAAA